MWESARTARNTFEQVELRLKQNREYLRDLDNILDILKRSGHGLGTPVYDELLSHVALAQGDIKVGTDAARALKVRMRQVRQQINTLIKGG